MIRRFFVWMHRWTGLAMAVFLIIVALTGSVLAFRASLDDWLNPGLLTVTRRDAPLLDGFTLRDKAAALYPQSAFDNVPLEIAPDRAVEFRHMPGMKADDNMMEKMVEFFLDPYTGERLGERPNWSGPSLERKNLISFIMRLHFALVSPFNGWYIHDHSFGAFLLGIVALLWTVDCFVAFYLTFPLRFVAVAQGAPGAHSSWWSRWVPAWLIKRKAGFYRLNFDIHRACGLWTWALLFIFAWSSVALNLGEVYGPTMKFVFGPKDPPAAETPQAPAPPSPPRVESPKLGYREAYRMAGDLLKAEAGRRGFHIEKEQEFDLDRDGGVYTLFAQGSKVPEALSGTWTANVDANTGEPRGVSFSGDAPPPPLGDRLTAWFIGIHLANLYGLPLRILVCALGLVITALSVTGVYIWWKKRKARGGASSKVPLGQPT